MTVTIQIGNSDNKLTQEEWADFVSAVSNAVSESEARVHFFAPSPGAEK